MAVTYGIVFAVSASAFASRLGETPLSAALIGFVLGFFLALAINLAVTGRAWPSTDDPENLRVDR